MTSREQLEQTRNNLIATLHDITLNPKPNYSIDGESWSWADYQSMLVTQIQQLRQLIDEEDESGIVEERTELY